MADQHKKIDGVGVVDLSFVSLEELLSEIEERCESFICGYTLPDEQLFYHTRLNKGAWWDKCAVSNILNARVVQSGMNIDEEEEEE